MNWKREAADKLRNYEAHREALDSIPKEIKRLELAYAGIRSATTDTHSLASFSLRFSSSRWTMLDSMESSRVFPPPETGVASVVALRIPA